MARRSRRKKLAILIVDDQYRTFQCLPGLISPDVFSAIWVPDEQEGLKILRNQPDEVQIIVVDLKSSGMGGGGFLQKARQIAPQAAVLITGPVSPFLYQGGAFYEFSGPSLKRDINTVLVGIAQKIGWEQGVRKDSTRLCEPRERFGVIIGKSEGINEIYQTIENLKESSATVLIQGESGTGKELVARTIHQTSPRKERPFVAINCGAIPSTLMESELFGHERGAFTTAISQRKGKFEVAERGTLFLDEIGELGRDLQVKLLRVLQEKEFQRVGGNKTYRTDVRIIAATSQDLSKTVRNGHFRKELFYRLNVVPISLPALRERKEDIPLLFDHFTRGAAKELGRPVPFFTDEAREVLMNYSFPGNVRELANLVERLLVTCPDGVIKLQDLPGEVLEDVNPKLRSQGVIGHLPEGGISLREMEKELILKTLRMTSGNKQAAAKILGITRRMLYLRLAQYGIAPQLDVT